MDPQQLANIINIVLIVLFCLVLVGFVIAALIGMKRGVFSATFRFLFMGALVVICFACCGAFGNWIGNINLQNLLSSFGQNAKYIYITNTDTGQTFYASITSIYETLAKFIYGTCKVMNIDVGQSLISYSTSLASVIMNLASFFVLGIFVCTLGNLFALLLWHIVFKRFIPKRIRRRRKIRLVAAIEEILKYCMVGSMIIFPLTSVLSTLSRAYKNAATGDSDSELAQYMDAFVNTYDNSIFANVFFNWTGGSNGVSFDTRLMDWVLSTQFEDTTTSIYDLLNSIGAVGGTLVSNGVLTILDGTVSFETAPILANADIILTLLESISSSELLLYAIPVALSIAMNLDGVSEYLDASKIDVFSYDWNAEIDNIQSIVSDIFESGFLDTFVEYDIDGNPIGWKDLAGVNISDIIGQLVDEEAYAYIRRVLLSIDESELLSTLIPMALYSMSSSGKVGELSNYLPDNWDEYENIKWGRELSIIYRTIYDVKRADADLFDTLISSIAGNEGGGTSPEPIIRRLNNTLKEEGETTPDILKIVLDNVDTLKTILVGSTDSDGNPLYVDEYGFTKVFDSEGNRIDGRDYNLLDSSLLKYLINPLIDLLTKAIEENASGITIDAGQITAIVSSLNTERRAYNFKKELGALFDSLGIIGQSDAIYGYIMDSSSSTAIVIEDGKIKSVDPVFVEDMSSLLRSIDKSKLMSEIIPPIIENVFKGDDVKNSLSSFGVNVDSFNFDVPNIGSELALLVDSLDGITFLVNNFTESGDISQGLTKACENEETILNLLETFYNSNIINPKDSSGAITTNNFTQLIKGVFTKVMPVGYVYDDTILIDKWANSRTIDGDYYRDANGNILYDGELGYLVNFIGEVGKYGIYDVLSTTITQSTIGQLETTYHISELFTAIGKSKLMSSTFGSLLDSYLEPYGIVDETKGISFSNITDWEKEGQTFGDLCTCLGKFTDDLQNINFLKCNPTLVLELLDTLVDSQIFIDKVSGDYVFANFVYDKLKANLSSGTDYFKDPGSNPATYNEVKSDFDKANTLEAWKNLAIRTEGKTDLNVAICNVIKLIQDANTEVGIDISTAGVDPIAVISNASLSDATLKSLVLAVNDVDLFRMVICNAVDSLLATKSTATLPLTNANTGALVSMTKAERNTELSSILDIYSNLKVLGLVSGSSFSLSSIKENLPLLKDTLTKLHSSYSFNSFASGDTRPDAETITVFEEVIKYILTSQNLSDYILTSPTDTINAHIIDVQNKHADSSLSTDGWIDTVNSEGVVTSLGEISRIYNMIDSATRILNSSGNLELSFDFFLNLINTAPTAEEPLSGKERLTNFFKAVNSSDLMYRIIPGKLNEVFSDPASSSSFSSLLPDLDLSSANAYCYGDQKYADSEITNLMDIISNFASIKNVTSLLSIDVTILEDTLIRLNESQIFHRSGPANSGTYTVFQQMMLSILKLSDIAYVNYNAASPKDMHYASIGAYTNNNEKAGYLVNNLFDWNASSFDDQISSVSDFSVFFTNIKDILDDGSGGLIPLNTLDFNSLTDDQIRDLLNSMNDINFLQDSVPNTIHIMLSKIPSMGIDITSAKPYFFYYDEATLTTDYSRLFPTSEIDNLISVYDMINDFTSKLNDSTYFSDLSNLTPAETQKVKDLLKGLSGSNVFHLAGSNNLKPTVFEQTVIQVYTKANIVDLIYSSSRASDVSTYGSAENKITALVSSFKDSSLFTTGLNNNNWNNEIDDLIAMIDEIYVLTNNGATSISSINLSSFSPTDNEAILNAMVNVDCIADIVPNKLSEAFTSLGLSGYTTLSSVDYANYYIGQANYANTEISLLGTLLEGFYDSATESYIQIGTGSDSLSDFTTNHSTVNMIYFLRNSLIYSNQVKIVGANAYLARDLFFFNLLDDAEMSKYIRGANDDAKCIQIAQLFFSFDSSLASSTKEGLAIDHTISLLNDLKSASFDLTFLSDNITTITDTLRGTFTMVGADLNTFERYYLVSEIVAGVFDDVMSSQYDALLTKGYAESQFARIDFYANNYIALNEWEALGIDGGIKASLETEKNVMLIDTNIVRSSFKMMGEISGSSVNVGHGFPLGYGNSKISSIFYLNYVCSNVNTQIPGFLTVLHPEYANPYATGFIFENVGNTIADQLDSLIP